MYVCMYGGNSCATNTGVPVWNKRSLRRTMICSQISQHTVSSSRLTTVVDQIALKEEGCVAFTMIVELHLSFKSVG